MFFFYILSVLVVVMVLKEEIVTSEYRFCREPEKKFNLPQNVSLINPGTLLPERWIVKITPPPNHLKLFSSSDLRCGPLETKPSIIVAEMLYFAPNPSSPAPFIPFIFVLV